MTNHNHTARSRLCRKHLTCIIFPVCICSNIQSMWYNCLLVEVNFVDIVWFVNIVVSHKILGGWVYMNHLLNVLKHVRRIFYY